MALNIEQVETQIDIEPAVAPPEGAAARPAGLGLSRGQLRELLTPVVLEILADELDRLQRRHG